jgi:hypothetical protein
MPEAKPTLDAATIESFAIRVALGNNGGKWSEHYTEDQKDRWRKFVVDLASEIAKANSVKDP